MTEQTILRQRLREKGVEFIDENQVYLREDTEIGKGTIVEPFVVFGLKVKIASGCRIKAFLIWKMSRLAKTVLSGRLRACAEEASYVTGGIYGITGGMFTA